VDFFHGIVMSFEGIQFQSPCFHLISPPLFHKGMSSTIVSISHTFERIKHKEFKSQISRQSLLKGVALGLGFVFTISFLAFRKSKLQAVGKKGPLLETAPIFLVPCRVVGCLVKCSRSGVQMQVVISDVGTC